MSNPYTPAASNRRFVLPLTLESDFDNFLNNDLPNQVMDFIHIPDWYAYLKNKEGATVIRGEFYPDSTKSRYEDTDNNMNIRCSLSSGIVKGDMVIASNNNQVYVLDWETAPESNNIPSRALRCNMYLTVYHHREEETDELGYLITPEGDDIVCDQMPANAYRYDGRPEFSASKGTPGVVANALTILTVQCNEKTRPIQIDDRFIWGNDEYTIIDVNFVGVGLDGKGTLKLQAKKTAGGHQ